jgi:hypothetical protein
LRCRVIVDNSKCVARLIHLREVDWEETVSAIVGCICVISFTRKVLIIAPQRDSSLVGNHEVTISFSKSPYVSFVGWDLALPKLDEIVVNEDLIFIGVNNFLCLRVNNFKVERVLVIDKYV